MVRVLLKVANDLNLFRIEVIDVFLYFNLGEWFGCC
jgi:hypothetical protein